MPISPLESAAKDFCNSEFFAGRVETYLEQRGMEKQDLAASLGITCPALSHMLAKGNPNLYTVIRVCKALGVRVSDFLDEAEEYC